MGDIDGDGRADVCARAAAGMRCYRSQPSGFAAAIDGPAWNDASGWGFVGYWSTIRLGDVADGKPELPQAGGDEGDGCGCRTGTGGSPFAAFGALGLLALAPRRGSSPIRGAARVGQTR